MVFVILTIFGLVMVIGSLLKVPESLAVTNRETSSGLKTMFKNFKILLKTPRFVLPMLIQGMTFVILFTIFLRLRLLFKNLWHDCNTI